MPRVLAAPHDNPTHWVERRTYPDVSTILIERPETVTIGYSSLKTGVSRTGKPWKRWQRDDRITFSVRTRGTGRRSLHVYRYERRHGETRFGNRTALIQDLIPLSHRPLVAAALRRLWQRNIGDVPPTLQTAPLPELTVGLAFPALAGRPLRHRTGFAAEPVAPTGLSHAWRENTARGVAEQLFGRRALRKDLIRATATVNPMRAGVAHAVRGLVPVDHLVEYLQQNGNVAQWDRKALRTLFTVIAPSARRRLLLQTQAGDVPRAGWGISDETRIIHDALRTVRDLDLRHDGADTWVTDEVRKPKNWRSLHDDLSALLLRDAFPNEPIPPTRHARDLDGLTTEAGVLRAAKQTRDLYTWGSAMSNCIAGYGQEAVAGETTLFGLYRDGDLIANLEVNPDGDVVQLFGRFNEELPAEQDEAVRDAIAGRLAPAAVAA